MAVVPVSIPQSETVHLLRLTSSRAHLIQAMQTMGANLQGLTIRLSHIRGTKFEVETVGRTITTLAPIEKYVAGMGQKLYDRIIRMEIGELNNLFEKHA